MFCGRSAAENVLRGLSGQMLDAETVGDKLGKYQHGHAGCRYHSKGARVGTPFCGTHSAPVQRALENLVLLMG